MLRFDITTLGCKVNQYDGQALAAGLEAVGCTPAGPHDPADLLVINTCCVTTTAMAKSRNALSRAVRKRPGAAVLIAGCYSDYDQKQLRRILDDLGVPVNRRMLTGHHHDVADTLGTFVRSLSQGGPAEKIRDDRPSAPCGPDTIKARRLAAVKGNVASTRNLPAIRRFSDRQRAFVKVQDGCDAFCSYCIVPYMRPRVWSRPMEEILDECRRLAAGGHREIVLCGVFLGAFGQRTAIRRTWPAQTNALAELLRRVCDIDGLWRVRLSSLEPGDVTDALLAALAECPKAAPHLHLPLQSGSPEILRRINRQYTADQYRRTVQRVRQALDWPALTTDVIVGLPGETDADFAQTLEIAREAGFAKIHAFPFSPIEGTAAWSQRDQAPTPKTVKARMAELAELEAELARQYRLPLVGRTVEALVERSRRGQTCLQAMTDRYQSIRFTPPQPLRWLTGQVVRLRVDAATAEGLDGTLVDRSIGL